MDRMLYVVMSGAKETLLAQLGFLAAANMRFDNNQPVDAVDEQADGLARSHRKRHAGHEAPVLLEGVLRAVCTTIGS
mgnify:CR=1 FL=1